eukprot:Skav212611  [mRNA]  locus=scaffold2176:244631:244930:+ [translate_table: standard]
MDRHEAQHQTIPESDDPTRAVDATCEEILRGGGEAHMDGAVYLAQLVDDDSAHATIGFQEIHDIFPRSGLGLLRHVVLETCLRYELFLGPAIGQQWICL